MKSPENNNLPENEYSAKDVEKQIAIIFEHLKDNFEKLKEIFDIFGDLLPIENGIQTGEMIDKDSINFSQNLSGKWCQVETRYRQEQSRVFDFKNVGDFGYRIILTDNNKDTNFEINKNGEFKFVEFFGYQVVDTNQHQDKGIMVLDKSGVRPTASEINILIEKLFETETPSSKKEEKLSLEQDQRIVSYLQKRTDSFDPLRGENKIVSYKYIVRFLSNVDVILKRNLQAFQEALEEESESGK